MPRSEVNGSAGIRIGELSRRVGVGPETLRAGAPLPGARAHRSDGNFRLYSAADEARVRAMLVLLADGLAPAEAAKLARDSSEAGSEPGRGRPRPDPRPRRWSARASGCWKRCSLRRADGRRDPRLGLRPLLDRQPAQRTRPAPDGRGWRALARRRGRDRRGAFLTAFMSRPPSPWRVAGRGGGAARAARMPAGRASRHRPGRLRDRARGERLADHLSGRGHPGRGPGRGGRAPRRRPAGGRRGRAAAAGARTDRVAAACRAPRARDRGAAATPVMAEAIGAAYLGGDPVSAARTLVSGGVGAA